MPHSLSKSNVTLRDSREHDFETLYTIDQACFSRGIAYSRRTLRWFLSLAGAECVVAESEGQIIAFILTHAEGPEGQIVTLDVLDAHRRSGVGTLLLCDAESRMQARGVREITLETATNNHAAVAFWEKHGYRTEAVLKKYYMGRVDAFQMRKVLFSHAGANPRGPAPEAS